MQDGVVNTLTVEGGTLGNMCDKKTVTVYIRPQRYTKKSGVFAEVEGRTNIANIVYYIYNSLYRLMNL